jgi:hypothetical protein
VTILNHQQASNMKNSTLKALGAYLRLSDKDKIHFLDTVSKIEKMPNIVRDDYIKTLLSLTSNEEMSMKDNPAGIRVSIIR